MSRRLHPALAAALAAALAGCAGGDPLPDGTAVPGTVVATLAAPAPADGALLLRLSGGPAPDSAWAARSGVVVHLRRAGETDARVVVLGDVRPGELVRLRVPDVRRWNELRAEVLEVADGADGLRPSVSGYVVSLSR